MMNDFAKQDSRSFSRRLEAERKQALVDDALGALAFGGALILILAVASYPATVEQWLASILEWWLTW